MEFNYTELEKAATNTSEIQRFFFSKQMQLSNIFPMNTYRKEEKTSMKFGSNYQFLKKLSPALKF